MKVVVLAATTVQTSSTGVAAPGKFDVRSSLNRRPRAGKKFCNQARKVRLPRCGLRYARHHPGFGCRSCRIWSTKQRHAAAVRRTCAAGDFGRQDKKLMGLERRSPVIRGRPAAYRLHGQGTRLWSECPPMIHSQRTIIQGQHGSCRLPGKDSADMTQPVQLQNNHGDGRRVAEELTFGAQYLGALRIFSR